jgi:hypothetical protein
MEMAVAGTLTSIAPLTLHEQTMAAGKDLLGQEGQRQVVRLPCCKIQTQVSLGKQDRYTVNPMVYIGVAELAQGCIEGPALANKSANRLYAASRVPNHDAAIYRECTLLRTCVALQHAEILRLHLADAVQWE